MNKGGLLILLTGTLFTTSGTVSGLDLDDSSIDLSGSLGMRFREVMPDSGEDSFHQAYTGEIIGRSYLWEPWFGNWKGSVITSYSIHYTKLYETSEDKAHPIEGAFNLTGDTGWRAPSTGEQTIRLRFDRPCDVRRIHLVFLEHEHQRTQEFLLRWSAGNEDSYRDVVRQQYTFSPPGNSREVEDYLSYNFV